jgi:SAM-dependent methyltransferase
MRIDKEKDAFGQGILDYYHGKTAVFVIERDDGYVDAFGGPEEYFREFKDWSKSEKKAMQLVKGPVLDIGCGAGRFALYLQDKGLEVIAIDNSPLCIQICSERGLQKAILCSIDEIDTKLGKFRTILMLGNNFGLFGNYKRARRLLKQFHGITYDRANIICETLDPSRTEETHHIEYQEQNIKRGRMRGQIKIRIRYLKHSTPWFDYLFVTKQEMERMIDSTGWRVQKYIDSDGSSYISIIEKDRISY